MTRNDPSDTGGLFVGRRPGTAPVQLPAFARESRSRRRLDHVAAVAILAVETILCLSVFGPQPLAWLWVGSQAEYATGSLSAGISTIMLGSLSSLMLTMVLANRLDHTWQLLRCAAGHRQEQGALESIFAVSVSIAVVCFAFWFFVVAGPGPSLAPTN